MISSLALYKESRFPASKKRKAAALDGIDYKEESRFPAPKKRKAAALDGIDYKNDETLKALGKQADKVKKGLDQLEKRFRVPPKTKGYVYDADKVTSRIELAQYYVGSTWDAPTETAAVYIELARVTLDDALEALNRFMSEDVAAFGSAVGDAGIGLFSPVPPLQSENQTPGI